MRNRLHSICPYFAMFPESFVLGQLMAFSSPGSLVFDPFCGRGTTVLESVLRDREAIGIDINPVAACVSGAKADPPTVEEVCARLTELAIHSQSIEMDDRDIEILDDEFFSLCFERTTLLQIIYLRKELRWQTCKVDRFIAAVALGCLHGESHKTTNCLSNRMPRTISTKPGYSVKWWRDRELLPPRRDVFEVLQRMSMFRLDAEIPQVRGVVRLGDARNSSQEFSSYLGQVDLIVTSPPYLDTTDFAEDQWLRLWFLGGPTRPRRVGKSDDRHTSLNGYWEFIREVWRGCASLLHPGSVLVVRIGGKGFDRAQLLDGLRESLTWGLSPAGIRVLEMGVTSEIKNRQTNSFRPGTKNSRFEHDFVFEVAH